VVTVTLTVSGASAAGTNAEIAVSLITEKPTGFSPKNTVVALLRLVPAMVTVVPPVTGPTLGLKPVIVGAPTKVNWSAALVVLGPPGEITVTSPSPATDGGDGTVIDVSLFTVNPVAAVVPKSTAVAAVKPVPLIVTVVPPDAGPSVGVMPVTRGAGTNDGSRLRKAWLDASYNSLPCASNALKAGSNPAGAPESTDHVTTEPVKSQVAVTHPE
jgi:hypothetical protein